MLVLSKGELPNSISTLTLKPYNSCPTKNLCVSRGRWATRLLELYVARVIRLQGLGVQVEI